METNETPHPDYIKGFNEGYYLTKHLPGVAEKLAETKIDSPRHKGFQDGRSQFERENEKTRRPGFLQKDRLSQLKDDKDVSKDHEERDRD